MVHKCEIKTGLMHLRCLNPSAHGVAAKLCYVAAEAAWQISCTSIVSPNRMLSIFPLTEDEIIQRLPSANILLVFLQGRDLTRKVNQSRETELCVIHTLKLLSVRRCHHPKELWSFCSAKNCFYRICWQLPSKSRVICFDIGGLHVK